jgi:hypothetical protein
MHSWCWCNFRHVKEQGLRSRSRSRSKVTGCLPCDGTRRTQHIGLTPLKLSNLRNAFAATNSFQTNCKIPNFATTYWTPSDARREARHCCIVIYRFYRCSQCHRGIKPNTFGNICIAVILKKKCKRSEKCPSQQLAHTSEAVRFS